jgi:hypothetical protein
MGVHILRPPLNVKQKDKHHFQDDGFGFPELNVFDFSDAVITYDGVCISNNELIWESIHLHRDRVELCRLLAAETYTEKILLLKDSNSYLIIHSPFFNIYHWITESIPRLWMVKDNLENLTLLLPEELSSTRFEEFFLPFKIKKIHRQSRSTNIKLKHLVLPELKPFFQVFDPLVLNQVREFYFKWSQDLSIKIIKQNSLSKAYLKLTTDKGKAIINKAEMERTLISLDFELLDTDELDLPTCIQNLSKVDFLVSLDCHELGYMQFLKQACSIFELKFEPGNDVDLYCNRFWHMASCLGLNYYYQFGTHVSYAANDFLTKGYAFDLKLLERNIIKMLNQPSMV